MGQPAPRHSLLDAEHRALGARMVPFGGWEMPLRYGSVLDEHRACREGAVTFDVSHLGSVWVRGPGAFDALQGLLTNDLTKVGPGRAQYTHLLDEADAHVVDDIIVWWTAADQFLVIPNASNPAPALDALRQAAASSSGGAEVEDVTGERAFLAVQGPLARARLGEIAPEAAAVGHFRVGPVPVPGGQALVGGTGYTGEDGVELFLPAEVATGVWRAPPAAGCAPAGPRAPGWSGLGGGLGQARLPGPGSSAGRAPPGARPAPDRHRARRPPGAAGGMSGPAR